jgi:hypothetical protein
MNRWKRLALVAGILCALLWMVDDIRQYWNAKQTIGTVEAVELREKKWALGFLSRQTFATLAWSEGDLDRRADMRYEASRRQRVDPAYVGMKLPIVYVESKPHLARLVAHHQRYRAMWIPLLLLSLFVWLEWRGKLPQFWRP